MTHDEMVELWLKHWDFDFLFDFLVGKATPSKRKLRLFAVACCRSNWHLIAGAEDRHAIDVAERFADGQATEEDLRALNARAESICQAAWGQVSSTKEASLAYYVPAQAQLVTTADFNEVHARDAVDIAG